MKVIQVNPPVYFYLALVLMVLLHFLLPIVIIVSLPWSLTGIPLVFLGALLNLFADRSFKQRQTTVKPLEDTTALVTSGVFRVSRNPMYLGFVLILLGIALLLGSLTPFLPLSGFTILMDSLFIRFEEKKLQETFGQDWSDYKRRVRRWA